MGGGGKGAYEKDKEGKSSGAIISIESLRSVSKGVERKRVNHQRERGMPSAGCM